MKKLTTALCVFICFLICSPSSAQISDPRPSLFAAYPEQIVLQEAQLAQYFTKVAGSTSDVTLSPGFEFSGKVSSNDQKYPNLQSVVIRSTNFQGALLQLSKIINPDNSISYSCHILSNKASDGYEMKPTGSGEYILSKVKSIDLLQDCKY